jgi:hypothetical protein
MAMTLTNLTEMINIVVNKALGAGLTAAQIQAALTAQETALAAVLPVPTHSRLIEDPGPALNPSQP